MKHFLIFLKWLAALLVVLLLVAAWLFDHDRAPAGAPMGEQVSDNEAFLTAGIVRAAIDTSVQWRTNLMENTAKPNPSPTPSSDKSAPGYRADTYRRDAHSKSHGCVKATFKVDQVEDRLAFGVFAHPGQYDAVIRFSSGSFQLQPDSIKDPRGMAIKLFNVPGKKLLPFEEDETTQDFLMMNNTVLFFRTAEEYAQFTQMLAYNKPLAYFIDPKVSPLKWHLRELWLAYSAAKPRPESLATTRFYSASAYALGPNTYVKYSAVPCSSNKVMPPDAKQSKELGYDYLRLELANQAASGGACFDFMVQPQVVGKNMPVEDTTVEWNEVDSPFIKVATITFQPDPNSNSADNNTACEALSYNPWHSLASHRPVGVLNRVRKAVYQEMSRFRTSKNCVTFCQEKCAANACSPGCSERCTAACPLLSEPAKAELPTDVCHPPGLAKAAAKVR